MFLVVEKPWSVYVRSRRQVFKFFRAPGLPASSRCNGNPPSKTGYPTCLLGGSTTTSASGAREFIQRVHLI